MFKRVQNWMRSRWHAMVTILFIFVMLVALFSGVHGIIRGITQESAVVPGSEIRSHLDAKSRVLEVKFIQWVYDHSTKISRAQCREIVQEVMKYPYPELLLAIMELESIKFTPGALSSTGDIGWCQINAKVHGQELIRAGIIKEIRDLWDTGSNIRAGAYILEQKFKYSKGDVAGALGAYRGRTDTAYVLRILSNHANLTVKIQS